MSLIIVYLLATIIGMNAGVESVQPPLTVIEESPVLETHEASSHELGNQPTNYPLDIKEITSDYQGSLDSFSKYKSLEQLELQGRSNLTGIENLQQLKRLILMPNYEKNEFGPEITIDLSKIAHLESLSVFGHVNGSKVTFTNTSEPVHIKNLNLHIVDVNNIKALGALSELSSLEIENCNADQPIDLSPFKKLKHLTNWGLTVQNRTDRPSFEDSFIGELKSLQSVTWYEKGPVQAKGLDKQAQLESLELYGFALDTYDLTASHPLLKRAHFEKCSFHTLTIENHTNLSHLGLADTQVHSLKFHSNLNLKTAYIYKLNLKEIEGRSELLSIPDLFIEGDKDDFLSE